MWYPPTLAVAPATMPVTLEEAKAHLLVEHSDDDAVLIPALIAAAVDHVEKYGNIRVAASTLAIKCDRFSDVRRLPVAPCRSVVKIEYVDPAGATQELADTVYEERFDGFEAAIVLKLGQRWPDIEQASRVTLTVEVGYETVPPAVKLAMLRFISNTYHNRTDAVVAGRTPFDDLMANFRRGSA